MVLSGYDGDGVLLSILFLIILIINLMPIVKKKFKENKSLNILTFIFGAIILTISVYKIVAFYEDVFTFRSDDPIISYAGAGVHLKSGLFIIVGLSTAILFFSSLGIFFTKSKRIVALIGFLFCAGAVTYLTYNVMKNNNRLDKIAIEENLNTHFNKMGNALITKDSEQFVEYIHPILYQSIGGKGKMVELMSALYEDVEIKEGKIIKVFKTKTRGDVIQALLMQSFTFRNAEGETESTTKSFAFSYDGGRTWSFAGIENRTFDEMRKILPELFEELRY